MRNLLIATLALAALAAASAAAQPAQTPPAQTQAAPAQAAQTAATDTATHEMCKSVMGRKMDAKQPHDHGRDKSGAATWPNGKPLSDAEMAEMHKRCAEKMAKHGPAK